MYFGVKPKTQPKKQGGLMGMIQNMMSELGAPDDSDEGTVPTVCIRFECKLNI